MNPKLLTLIEDMLDAKTKVSTDIEVILKDVEIRKKLQDRLPELNPSLLPNPTLEFKEEIASRNDAEAIILVAGRPVLFVQNDSFVAPVGNLWQDVLKKSQIFIESAIKAVGRIEVRNHPRLPWIGTAWLVAPDILVTNRHVAVEFAAKENNKFVFRHHPNGRVIRASIDFKVEHKIDMEAEFKIEEILYIEDNIKLSNGSTSPDIAFLKISSGSSLSTPISLLSESVEPDRNVAVIGYPARDSRNSSQVMDRIFGNIYNVKRLHPGKIVTVTPSHITHDCSTLGGNSGSVVLDLETGKAVGLHFGGSYRKENYAVSASVIRERLDKIS